MTRRVHTVTLNLNPLAHAQGHGVLVHCAVGRGRGCEHFRQGTLLLLWRLGKWYYSTPGSPLALGLPCALTTPRLHHSLTTGYFSTWAAFFTALYNVYQVFGGKTEESSAGYEPLE